MRLKGAGVVAALLGAVSCAPEPPGDPIELTGASPHLFLLVGDQDEQDEDFALVLNVDPSSPSRGEPVSSLPIGHKASMVHHTEYNAPPVGEAMFMNAHHHELTVLVNFWNPQALAITGRFRPPDPFRFPHDYARTPSGTRLVGFLRSEGAGPNADETASPGNHGGVAEYSAQGELLRTVSAADPRATKSVRPYSFRMLPEMDRFVVTSAPMMESSWADVIQVYSYSDFELLHTLPLEVGVDHLGNSVSGENGAAFGQHVLDDGSIFLNSYGCNFYHLTGIDSDEPKVELVYALETEPEEDPGRIRGACGIPLLIGQYWVQPVGARQEVVVLDIANPKAPREVFRLETPDGFSPHWLGKDPAGNRLILGAELGGEQGFYMLRIDEVSGRLGFDPDFADYPDDSLLSMLRSKSTGYISLSRQDWPHGSTGPAWGHAAVFFEGQ